MPLCYDRNLLIDGRAKPETWEPAAAFDPVSTTELKSTVFFLNENKKRAGRMNKAFEEPEARPEKRIRPNGLPANLINLPVQVKAGGPAVSSAETLGFPTPPRDGCGFIQLSVLDRKAGQSLTNKHCRCYNVIWLINRVSFLILCCCKEDTIN